MENQLEISLKFCHNEGLSLKIGLIAEITIRIRGDKSRRIRREIRRSDFNPLSNRPHFPFLEKFDIFKNDFLTLW